jgi:glutamyl-Q tRNA(Asp) synthetase
MEFDVPTPETRPLYRGRFAPSPTGPLHFGSLIAAVGSYLQACTRQGEWWLRIEDIDPPREVPGAADTIRRQLEAFGFVWDRYLHQSDNQEIFEALLKELRQTGAAYPCGCSRKSIIARTGQASHYPGTCREGLGAGVRPRSWRIRTSEEAIVFDDPIQGRITTRLDEQGGDFILKRADGLIAYQLAVAADDAMQGMTEVVRGRDLMDSTPRQLHVQQMLGLDSPRYTHLPVALNARGTKLSKQSGAPALDPTQPSRPLWQALAFLGQQPPPELGEAPPAEIWQWAEANWSLAQVPRAVPRSIEEFCQTADNP